MSNILLDIINERLTEMSSETEQGGFIIDNDEKAEWALRKIAEEQAEAQRYINVCQTVINEYQEKIRKRQEQMENKVAHLKALLEQYFEIVPKRRTATQEIYRLPSGTLRRKYLQPEIKRDEEKIIAWLKARNMKEYIKTKETLDWAELKKKIRIQGQYVVDENGEIVDGVEVIERPPKFEIEI